MTAMNGGQSVWRIADSRSARKCGCRRSLKTRRVDTLAHSCPLGQFCNTYVRHHRSGLIPSCKSKISVAGTYCEYPFDTSSPFGRISNIYPWATSPPHVASRRTIAAQLLLEKVHCARGRRLPYQQRCRLCGDVCVGGISGDWRGAMEFSCEVREKVFVSYLLSGDNNGMNCRCRKREVP